MRHNAAWDNIHDGFADGGNPAELLLQNNTAFRNGAAGFDMPNSPATFPGGCRTDGRGNPPRPAATTPRTLDPAH